MKKNLLLPLMVILGIAGANAQSWITEASGFPTPAQGILQIIPANAAPKVIWANSFDGTGNGTPSRDYTKSANSGDTWKPGTVTAAPNTYNWSCLAAVDKMKAWALFYDAAAGLGGALYRTTDGGTTWTDQGIFSGASFPDVVYFWGTNGVALGDPLGGYFEIYTSGNSGDTWKRVKSVNIPPPTTDEFGLTYSLTVTGNTIWCGTSNGRILKSTDFGLSWTVLNVTNTAGDYVVEMTFKDDNVGYSKVQNSSTAAIQWRSTTDGGITWKKLKVNSGTFFQDHMTVVPGTASTLVSVGVDFNVATGSSYSTNGGKAWTTIDSAVQHTAVAFISNTKGWSGGFNSDAVTDGMFKFSGTLASKQADNNKQIALLEVSPNPFSSSTNIKFSLSDDANVMLSLVDMQGKTHQVIASGVYKAGSHEVKLNRNALNTGIYLLQLKTATGIYTKQIVVQ